MHPLYWIDHDLQAVSACPFWMPVESWQTGQRRVRILTSEHAPHDPICWSFLQGIVLSAPKRALWLETCLKANHNKNMEQCAGDLLLAWFAETQTNDPQTFFAQVDTLPPLPKSLDLLQVSRGMILWEQQHTALNENRDVTTRRLPGDRYFLPGHPACAKLVSYWYKGVMTWEDLLNMLHLFPQPDCFLPEGAAFPATPVVQQS